MKLGKTGDFPRGKLSNDDEGGIKIAIGVRDKTVIVDFGTSVTWVGFPAFQARELGATLIEKADEIEGKK